MRDCVSGLCFFTLLVVFYDIFYLYNGKLKKNVKLIQNVVFFKVKWTWKYFFALIKDKLMCPVYNQAIAIFEEVNLSQPFMTKHNNATYETTTKEE